MTRPGIEPRPPRWNEHSSKELFELLIKSYTENLMSSGQCYLRQKAKVYCLEEEEGNNNILHRKQKYIA
jgi:hypothetical protein